jgi:nucleotide-binding universal stress UspA family protein
MRVIFVPVADRRECGFALHTAFGLGHTLGANVVGCHIRPHSYSEVSLPSDIVLPGVASSEAEWEAAWKPRNAKKTGAAAKELFKQIAEHHAYALIRKPRSTPGAVWMEKTGSPNRVLGIMGPVSDLLVVSRPAAKGGKLARMFLLAALLNSARPVLVLPQALKGGVGKRLCIAWNQSAEAARAVAAALPILQAAENVTIVTCGKENRAGPNSRQLATYLSYWGIKSTRVSQRGANEAKEILEVVRKTRSDLLVMGAYSRNRMSQLMFGGVTEFVIRRTTIPVFMLHT